MTFLSDFLAPLFSYFSQDDFFHLSMIMDKNLTDIPNFFINRLEGQTFYRPLSREMFNLVMYKSFGLNALAFHFMNLLLITLNITLVFLLTKKMSTILIFPIIATTVYSLSAVHSIELYYLASVQTLLATTLTLSSTYLYLNFRTGGYFQDYLGSLLLFLMALLSHESSIILPGILLILEVFSEHKFNFTKTFKLLFLFGFLGLIYLLSISTLFSLPEQQVYQPVFNLVSVLNTLMWYSLWSLNFPETLVDFVKDFKLNPNFIRWYGDYTRIIFLLCIIILTSLITITLTSFKKIFKNKLLLLFTFCYLVTLSPFLFFPQHKFVYYLSLPLVWFVASLALILSIAWQKGLAFKALAILIIIFFGIFAFQTTLFNQKTYWAAKRATAAKYLLEEIHSQYPEIPKSTNFYFLDDPDYPEIGSEWGTSSKQASYILSGPDALKLLYKDSSIKAFYQANGLADTPKSKLIYYVAKFPY